MIDLLRAPATERAPVFWSAANNVRVKAPIKATGKLGSRVPLHPKSVGYAVGDLRLINAR